jgi:hypothetical protein
MTVGTKVGKADMQETFNITLMAGRQKPNVLSRKHFVYIYSISENKCSIF